jgi:hypothetical protein
MLTGNAKSDIIISHLLKCRNDEVCKDRGTMNHRIILSAVGAMICLIAFCAEASGYSGGTGDPNNPFQISTVDDWLEMVDASADWDKDFILLNDIDFGGINLTPVAPDTQQDIYFYDGIPFSGYFDGNGHVIRNAVISHPDQIYVGLFGLLTASGEIRNLGVENVVVLGSYSAGIIAGANGDWDKTGGIISNCRVQGTITGPSTGYPADIGGVCGFNNGQVQNCTSDVSVTSELYSYYIGGLCGENNGTISECSSKGTIHIKNESYYLGGLCGGNTNGTISNCFSSVDVTGGDYTAGIGGAFGGFCGVNDYGSIRNCYSVGKVTGGVGSTYLGGVLRR